MTGLRRSTAGSRLRLGAAVVFATAVVLAAIMPAVASASAGELDCNGDSPLQHAVRQTMNCTDIRGMNTGSSPYIEDGRFYDNGTYIGHDEPDMTFLSGLKGSGNNVTWKETLPKDPTALPTVAHPGSDVAHWFELSVAPWFSMALCDPHSYPQTGCTPQSDANAPTPPQSTGGGGSAFMEMQFYPPGFAPFADSISCDNAHWCSALTIDSLECTAGFKTCNTQCEEPVNFAYIQTNGVPAGPVAPSNADLATYTPNSHTLLMNPGDTVSVHMGDAAIPGGGGAKAFKVTVTDHTTGQSGYMQASGHNGFENTNMSNCSGTFHNFQPEYNTAAKNNIVPWAALQTNISTQFETGHFTPCTSVTDPGSYQLSATISDTFYNTCNGPYEKASDTGGPEASDAFCYPAGDTHGALNSAPDLVTGCTDGYAQNGDLDFDGTPYWPEWPTGPTATSRLPGSFVQSLPTTGGSSQYAQFFNQTDLALSEQNCDEVTTHGCTVPPDGPGHFYPYWSRVSQGSSCLLEFGNVHYGGVNTMGQDAQYGTDQSPTIGYPNFEGPILDNTCAAGSGAKRASHPRS